MSYRYICNEFIALGKKATMIMEELLQRLEKQIKKLIDQQDQLKQSNQSLHQGKFILACEKELLLAKQRKAISQIETLVTRLKAIENLS